MAVTKAEDPNSLQPDPAGFLQHTLSSNSAVSPPVYRDERVSSVCSQYSSPGILADYFTWNLDPRRDVEENHVEEGCSCSNIYFRLFGGLFFTLGAVAMVLALVAPDLIPMESDQLLGTGIGVAVFGLGLFFKKELGACCTREPRLTPEFSR